MAWPRGRAHATDTIQKLTKYPVNDTLFDTIDNEHAAYWLGRLAADGNSHPATGITLSAAEKDATNIKQFRDWISPGRPIHIVAQKKTFAGVEKVYVRHDVIVSSRRLASALMLHGIVPRKTALLTGPPETVPSDMLRHYYRGYFDGDGTVYKSARKVRRTKNYCHLSLLGTESFLLCFAQWVKDVTGIEMRTPYTKKGTAIWRIDVDGLRRVAIIAGLLYADSTVYLERKHARAMAIIAAYNKRLTKNDGYHINDERKQQVRDLYATGQYTIKEIAAMVGIGYGSAYCIAHNVRYPQDRKPKLIRLCSVYGCGEKHCAQGYCQRHYAAYARPHPVPQPCTVPGCTRTAIRRKLCKSHYRRFLSGQPLQTPIARSALTKEEEQDIIRLYQEEQHSQKDIMKILKVGENTINRALKRNGLPRRWNRSRL